MQNTDITFENGRVSMSEATYEELRAFCRQHGETDLLPFPSVFSGSPEKLITYASKSEEFHPRPFKAPKTKE